MRTLLFSCLMLVAVTARAQGPIQDGWAKLKASVRPPVRVAEQPLERLPAPPKIELPPDAPVIANESTVRFVASSETTTKNPLRSALRRPVQAAFHTKDKPAPPAEDHYYGLAMAGAIVASVIGTIAYCVFRKKTG